MEKSRPLLDRDNVSQRSYGSRTLHTYTPMSHEDLLRSHFQLDAARKNQLKEDVRKLQAENDKLKQELNNKNERINALTDQLRSGSGRNSCSDSNGGSCHNSQLVEIDGKKLTVDELINHFNVVIDRHHNIITVKNDEIYKLQNEINKQVADWKKKDKKDIQTQSSRVHITEAALDENRMNEVLREMTLMRKEYESVVSILIDRNKTLEESIKNLNNKLDQYAIEINYLRNTLSERDKTHQPSESTMLLIQEKEKENKDLRTTISDLKTQIRHIQEMPTTTKEIENIMKKILEDKRIAIDKMNNMINDIQKHSSERACDELHFAEVEKVCKNLQSYLTDIKEQLTNIHHHIKPKSPTAEETAINYVSYLEQLKKQCQNEIDTLYTTCNQFPSTVLLEGQAAESKDDPNHPNRFFVKEVTEITTKELANVKLRYVEPNESFSERQHHDESQSQLTSIRKVQSQISVPTFKYTQISSVRTGLCEACGLNLPTTATANIPLEEKCSKKYIEGKFSKINVEEKMSKRNVEEKDNSENMKPTPSEKNKKRPKSGKGGCCGKKGSETSNVPYYKEEKVLKVHSSTDDDIQGNRSKSLPPKVKNKIYVK